MDYALVRWIHVSCVGISIALFTWRGVSQLTGTDWRRRRWLRVAPHINDSMLLGAAITLSIHSAQYPLAQPWLTAKIVALLLYIGFGRLALRPGLPAARQRAAFAAALLSVAYIVGVALTRSPALQLV